LVVSVVRFGKLGDGTPADELEGSDSQAADDESKTLLVEL
jgi:hypothetical protein